MGRLITDILRDVRGGKAVAQATALLTELVQAVDETGKSGEVTIKIKVAPEEGGGAQKILTVECKMKKPLAEIPKGIFFSNADGDLLRTDPNQKEMFKEVEAGAENRVPARAL